MKLRRIISALIRKITCNPLVYMIYEKILWNQIKDGEMPDHIGVILDGNRRWAEEHYIPPWGGHQIGADKVEDLLHWCLTLNVRTITLYLFSTENFDRSGEEIREIMNLFEERLKKMLTDEIIHKNQVQIRAIGRITLLPDRIQKLIHIVEEDTKSYNNHYLNMAIAYGGRAEIVDATKKIAEAVTMGTITVDGINEKTIEEHLYTAYLPKSDLDLIIRTSGEERLSGFLLWQGAYSELCFVDVYWPDLRRIDIWRAIRIHQQRERRYGT